jgi:hypothetical protein
MGRHNKIHWDLDALKQMYEQDRLTVQQIGERLGCSGADGSGGAGGDDGRFGASAWYAMAGASAAGRAPG